MEDDTPDAVADGQDPQDDEPDAAEDGQQSDDSVLGEDAIRSGGVDWAGCETSASAQVANSAVAEDAKAVSPEAAETAARSMELVAAFESAIVSLRECGAMNAVVNLENESAKERRRMRALSRENPDVLDALAKQQCAEMARERKHRAAVADADARSLQLVKVNSQLRGRSEALKQKRKAIADADALLEAKHALKTFSPKNLAKASVEAAALLQRRLVIASWIVSLAWARGCRPIRGMILPGGKMHGARRCSRRKGTLGQTSSRSGCRKSWTTSMSVKRTLSLSSSRTRLRAVLAQSMPCVCRFTAVAVRPGRDCALF